MGTFILKRKTYSSFGFKMKQAAHHAWDTTKGVFKGAIPGAIIGAAVSKNHLNGAAWGAGIGGSLGGYLGYQLSNPLKSKEQLEKEKQLESTIPSWIDSFIKKLSNLIKKEKNRIKDSWKKALNPRQSDFKTYEDFEEFCYFPELINCQGSPKKNDKDEYIIYLGMFIGAHDNAACQYIKEQDLIWNVSKKELHVTYDENSNKDTVVKSEKDLAKILKNIYSNSMEDLTTNVLFNYLTGGNDDLEVPLEYVTLYVEEFNKSRKFIINSLNNWK